MAATIRPNGRCSCSRCCRPTGSGPERSSPSTSASAPAPCGATSTASGRSATRSTPRPGSPAATGSPPAPTCRRCCSTTTKPSRSRSGCARPPRASIEGIGGHRAARAGEARAGAARPVAATGAAVHTNVVSLQWRRRTDASTPTRSRCSRWRVATASRCASTTAGVTATTRAAWSSHTSSCPTGRRWYLVAWDVRRDDWRTFRLDRLDGPGSPACGARHASSPAATPPRSSRESIRSMPRRTRRCSRSAARRRRCATRSTGATPRSRSSPTVVPTCASEAAATRRCSASSPGSRDGTRSSYASPTSSRARVEQLVVRLRR